MKEQKRIQNNNFGGPPNNTGRPEQRNRKNKQRAS